MCTHQRPKRRENINHEFSRKMFCLVTITFASPKVSVTASKQFPRRLPAVLKLFQINLAFLDVRLFTDISVNVFLVFLFLITFFVMGFAVSEFNQMYEILG